MRASDDLPTTGDPLMNRLAVITKLYELQDLLNDPDATPVRKVAAAQQHAAALIRELHEAELKDRGTTA